MPSDPHHHSISGSTPERLARIVGAMTFGTLILAGAYFGFLYLFAGR